MIMNVAVKNRESVVKDSNDSRREKTFLNRSRDADGVTLELAREITKPRRIEGLTHLLAKSTPFRAIGHNHRRAGQVVDNPKLFGATFEMKEKEVVQSLHLSRPAFKDMMRIHRFLVLPEMDKEVRFDGFEREGIVGMLSQNFRG